MELKYKSWDDITINIYNKLKNIKLDIGDEVDMLEYNVELLSVLCDVDVQEIENLPLSEFNNLLKQSEFISKEIKRGRTKFIYKINNKEYFFQTNPRLLTTAQFIDLQTYIKNKNEIEYILSCCLIPNGKKYGEYNLEEVIKEIREHLSIVNALSIQFFFIQLYRKLKIAFQTSLEKQIKKLKKKNKNKEVEIILEQAMNLIQSGVG